jgi:haloacetate dehalogenase
MPTLLDGFSSYAGFSSHTAQVDGIRVHAAVGGTGPPLLLLHGYPQNHVMWHRVAPELAARFTVVAADLRGYGDSGKPPGGSDHAGYGKRAMAADQVGLMASLGFDRFAVAGHDRGARVTHRMCLDHPAAVSAAAVLDIAPTRHMYATVDREFAQGYYHWFFLSQPADLPERLIGADPEFYLRRKLAQWSRDPDAFDEAAVAEYVRCFADPDTVRASCEDYRAAASIDLEHDERDAAAGNLVRCPLLVLWGAKGFVGGRYDVLAVWRRYAEDVRGRGLDCGHFLPEEQPAETTSALRGFFLEQLA